jgi:hypothetical protein
MSEKYPLLAEEEGCFFLTSPFIEPDEQPSPRLAPTVNLILGSMFDVEKETTENAGDAAVSGIPAAIAMNIAPTIYGHAHL